MKQILNNAVCIRSSLGRCANIGELYKISDEALSSRPLFKDSLPQKHVTTLDIANTDFKFEFTENFSDKFNFLKVETELQLGVMFELVKVQGSGEFLKETKKSEKVISCSLMCQIRTQQDKVFASYDEILPHVDHSALLNPEYTHYVSEVTWGANCLLTLEVAYEEEEQKKNIKGALKAGLSKIKKLVDVECGGGVTKNSSDLSGCGDLKINVHTDVVPKKGLPTNVEEFFNFLPTLPELLQDVNNGKGKPLSYVLTPLEEIRRFAEVENSLYVMVRKIDEGFVTSTVLFFDDIGTVKRRLNDLKAEFEENQNYVNSEDIRTAADMLNTLNIKESNLKELILDLWPEVRSGRKELRDLIIAVEKSKNYDLKLYKYEEYLCDCSPILKKLSTIKMYASKGVAYLGKEDTFVNLQLRHPSSEFIVLITGSELEEIDPDLCINTSLYFISLVDKHQQNTIYVVVDLDLSGGNSFFTEQVSRPKCLHLSGNTVVNQDLYASYLLEMDTNFARVNRQNFKLCTHRPGNRVPLEIPCPGFEQGTCSSRPCIWTCHTCKDNIEYGFDNQFYCTCGVCPDDALEYRCKDPKHGNRFVAPTKEFLESTLNSLRPLKEMNILILGHTGVGKTTWINSIVNYLTYDTMFTAKEHGVICTIPVRYGFHDPDTNELKYISIGEKRSGEEVEFGMSDTQFAHTYSFLWKDTCVRIIDTPGIGDTRGLHQDRENMRSIFEHLGYLEELHGLCILLKAVDCKSTTYFAYCIKELLIHLPKSIINNIVFCFTNSRGALYTAGPGSSILASLIREIGLEEQLPLGKHNMFRLDNEAFVFLSSQISFDFKYSPEVEKSYAHSWEMAVTETVRLFDTVKTFTPGKLSEMITLAKTRERILTLTKPLAEIGKTIQFNLTTLKKKEEELEESSMTVQELQEELFVEEVFLEMESLDYPQTVCTAKKCITVEGCGRVNQIVYTTVCHEKCSLPQVEPKISNNHALKKCDAMFAGYCTICGCGWETHMHLTYKQKRVMKKVKNHAVEKKIGKKETENKTKEQLISGLRETTKKYEAEHETIIKALGAFAVFLKNNAITVFNDSVKDYLTHLIHEQEKIIDKTEADEEVLNALKNNLEQYNCEVEFLQKLTTQPQTAGDFGNDKKSIKEIEESLYDLELTGEQIKQCVEVSRSCTARSQKYRETPIPIHKKFKNQPGSGFMKKVKNLVNNLF